ncbi:MAG: Gfo/Idh/MocA family oxidoreductase [Magnetospirillum sp.]|nr:Gfo/Idh/MocA family oxidoreductase [Magnetospirillum sp.]
MTKRLRVGIAGYGVVGTRRRQFIDAHPDLTTVAVCDRTLDGEGHMADGVAYYSHWRRLLECEQLDLLFVCLSNDVAAEVTIAGLERGLHVFCEKPPGRDVADIARVIVCERQHPGLKLKYGFNHRYHDSVRDALALVQSGELGRVVNLRGVYGKSKIIDFRSPSHWRTKREIAGGGILLDQGIHMVDLLRLFGGEFTEVHAIVSNDFWNHSVEDNAYALMRSETGAVAILHSTATQWRHRFNLEITLSRGMLVLSGILSGSKSYGAETLTVAWATPEDEGDPREQTTRYNRDPSWQDEVEEFAQAVLTDTPILHGSSHEALKTMELVYRIYCADPQWRDRWGLSCDIPVSLE